MATVKAVSKVDIKVSITLELDLEESKALLEMTRFGHKAFLEVFYKYLGKMDLQTHEKGFVSLFEKIKEDLPTEVKKCNKILQSAYEIKSEFDHS